MNVTKYEHACLLIEEQGQKLLIDPGVFSESCQDFENVCGVIVTHVHPDHFDIAKITKIVDQNPKVRIFTVQDVADKLGEQAAVTVVSAGQQADCGPFSLEFFGELHAVIHESYPRNQNVGVMINKRLYYPGDSLTVPHQPIDILALPSSAPWLKIGEAMDFIIATKAKRIFPTHNALLSEIGAGIHNPILQGTAQGIGADYIVLAPGQSISV